jgi:EAL domain-containing protein (putative c-di-GMP-specific phosphodiesterase class I)
VSVNAAASQLDNLNFPSAVAEALDRAGVAAHALAVEITESALLSTNAPTVLSDLADLGVQLDVDDFGTGYSSLAYLVRLPVHALKIDRTFTWGLEQDARLQTTVRAIVRLAHDLDLKCIVEGVETESQKRWLTGAGCDLLQGFGISRPVAAAQVPSLCEAALV